MNPFKDFAAAVARAVESANLRDADGNGPDLARATVEPPRDPSHGDLSTNVAMVLAKPLRAKPRDIADRIAGGLRAEHGVEAVEIAGPGFINVRLGASYWQDALARILTEPGFGRTGLGAGEKVNVEYVSTNPTGPMHVGHVRGAVVGDALANLLHAVGYEVTREYYVNDAGGQIDVLTDSVMLRYREALGEEIGEIPAGLYPGDYLVPLGRALADEHGDALLEASDERRSLVRRRAIDAMLDLIKDDLAALDVRHDVFTSEATLHAPGEDGRSAIERTIERMKLGGHVYRGTLPPPKGQPSEDWEDRKQTLFRSTAVGDDADRALVKSDGSYTYFAADVAYYAHKHERGFAWTVFVLGADHGGYVKRLQAVAKAIGGDDAKLTVLLVQLVRLLRGGELVKMSKRSGNLVTFREVVDEVGRDAVRFMMLMRKSDAPLDFDFEKVTEQSKDNPVFYVQYAHARCASVFRQAAEAGIAFDPAATPESLDALTDPSELALLRKVAEYERVLEQAATALEPHRIAFYLYDLASLFHSHWNLGKDRPDLRFVRADEPIMSRGRLALVEAVRRTLVAGLAVVGASAPDEMR